MLKREVWIEASSRETKVYYKGELIAQEPTVVALDSISGKIVAIGKAALEFIQSADQEQHYLVWPVHIAITDFHAFEGFLRALLNKNFSKEKVLGFLHPSFQMVFIIPSSDFTVDLRAWRDSGQHSGAAQVYFLKKSSLMMRGLGINPYTTAGCALVEVGSSMTEIYVMAKGRNFVNEQLPIGKNNFISSIQVNHKRTQNRSITEAAAEQLLEKDAAVLKWVDKYYAMIEENLWRVMDSLPTDVAQAVVTNGIFLYGVGATSIGIKNALTFEGKLALQVIADDHQVVAGQVRELNGKGFSSDIFTK